MNTSTRNATGNSAVAVFCLVLAAGMEFRNHQGYAALRLSVIVVIWCLGVSIALVVIETVTCILDDLAGKKTTAKELTASFPKPNLLWCQFSVRKLVLLVTLFSVLSVGFYRFRERGRELSVQRRDLWDQEYWGMIERENRSLFDWEVPRRQSKRTRTDAYDDSAPDNVYAR